MVLPFDPSEPTNGRDRPAWRGVLASLAVGLTLTMAVVCLLTGPGITGAQAAPPVGAWRGNDEAEAPVQPLPARASGKAVE
jgi:hypothetical protein